MREMKDSNVEWVGMMPASWGKAKFNAIYNNRNVKVSDRDFRPLSVTKKGVVPQLDTAAKTNDGDNRKLVKAGDFVINSRSDRRGSCGISSLYGSVSLINTVLEPKDDKTDPRFFGFLFHTVQFADEFYKWGHGIVDDLWTTNWNDMKNIILILPPKWEQKRIADFLDKKCGQIDKLLSQINDEIDTLKKYRHSLIIRVVTKGLDLNVSMKDSGIDWVGKIPKQWLTSKIKFYLYRNEPRNPGNVQVLSVYREYGVVPKDSRDDNHNVTSSDTSNYKYVTKGDLVINKMKAWQGSLAVSEYTGVVSPAYYVYHFKNAALDKKYFHYLIRNCYRDEFRRLSTGIRDGQWDLQAYDFENTSILVPPLKEQQQITNFLDKKCKYISNLIAEKRKQLNLLKEYKNSLIYEYVTGKKQVPMM